MRATRKCRMARCLRDVSSWKSSGLNLLCVCVFLAEEDDPIEIRELVYYGQEREQLEDKTTICQYVNIFTLVLPSDICSASLVTEAANDS